MQRNPRNKRSFAGFVAAQNLANQHIWSHVQHAQPRSVGQTIEAGLGKCKGLLPLAEVAETPSSLSAGTLLAGALAADLVAARRPGAH
ncbi:hypothetical protein L596_009529 [Steinernema carpocapsae]|uniref:Uncharacterized protein n=1 Tax=Steinernema carpocapsae TaxID=34508 RepID=A0A4U5PFT5_STECR|nr:hypothetical protein L596_009529 [Steinernema carpocapsae]